MMFLFNTIHPRILFFLGFLCFCLGIGFYGTGYSILIIFCFGILSITSILLITRYWKWQIASILILCFSFGLGLIHIHQQERIQNYTNLLDIFDTKQDIVGTIDRQMYTTDTNAVYRLLIDNFDTKVDNFDTTSTTSPPSIMVEVPKNLDIHINNTIHFTSTLRSSFESISNLHGFEKYAWYHKLYGKAYIWDFENKTREMPISFREQIQESLKTLFFRGFSKEVSAILLGITVGNTDFMSSQLKDDFQNSGLTHILVVSGSNITFLILFFSLMARYIPVHRYIKRTIIVLFLLVYGYIVGWDVPVIRATIMGIIGYIALESGHRRSVLAILIAIAWGILIFSPGALLYDAGFGLSFGATIGIIILYPHIESWFKQYFSLIPHWFIAIISITLAASIGSFPILIYHFGSYPITSIFANILIGGIIGPLLAITIFYIFFVSLFGFGQIILYFGYSLFFGVKIILWTASFFAAFPRINIPEPIQLSVTLIIIGIFIRYILFEEEKKIGNKNN